MYAFRTPFQKSGKWISGSLFSVILLVATLLEPRMLLDGLVIDGQFSDWAGQINFSDPGGDGPTPNTDMLTLYWGTNTGESFLYWMIERQSVVSGNPRVYYFIFLDINQNGSSSDEVDRIVQVLYDPQRDTSSVTMTVMTGTNTVISESSGDWGDSIAEGGARCEWRASFEDLGIDVHQPFDMRAGAGANSGYANVDMLPPPGDPPLGWDPVPVLGWPWLAALVTGFIIFTWRRYGRRVWQPS